MSALTPNLQRKYLGKLKGAKRAAREAEILYRREHRSNAPFATDVGEQTQRSSHAKAFERRYGRAAADVTDAARLTGIAGPILAEVYARGMAAWQTGHRPGASQHAWAMARVYSFATGGPTMRGPDADLARQAGMTKNPAEKRYNPAETFVPPPEVAAEARQALELRASLPPSQRCCTPVGIRRAAQLANRQPVSVDTLRRMRSYFARHAVDAKGKGWAEGTSKGMQAWLAWGGFSGQKWCNEVLAEIEAARHNPRVFSQGEVMAGKSKKDPLADKFYAKGLAIGEMDFATGAKASPARSLALAPLMQEAYAANRAAGKVATYTIALIDGYNRGWHAANAAAPLSTRNPRKSKKRNPIEAFAGKPPLTRDDAGWHKRLADQDHLEAVNSIAYGDTFAQENRKGAAAQYYGRAVAAGALATREGGYLLDHDLALRGASVMNKAKRKLEMLAEGKDPLSIKNPRKSKKRNPSAAEHAKRGRQTLALGHEAMRTAKRTGAKFDYLTAYGDGIAAEMDAIDGGDKAAELSAERIIKESRANLLGLMKNPAKRLHNFKVLDAKGKAIALTTTLPEANKVCPKGGKVVAL